MNDILYGTVEARLGRHDVLISSLLGRPLATPIPVTLERLSDDEFVAAAKDLNMAMSGDSAEDALSVLREYIEGVYDLFRDGSKLGPEPARQIQLLEMHFGEQQRAG